MRKAEYEIIEWIDTDYNDEDNDIAEVHWAPMQGPDTHPRERIQ